MSTAPQSPKAPDPPSPIPTAGAADTAAASLAAAYGEENVLWQGRTSWKDTLPVWILWGLGSLALLWVWWRFRADVSTHWLLYTVSVVILGSGLALLTRYAWRIYGTRYRLTTQRLFIERGILSRTTEQTELVRVDDVRTRQSILDRLFGLGDVEIVSSDTTQPKVLLAGIAEPLAVAEHVRNNTRAMRAKRSLFVEQL
jgi:membrane protein YdbS with pleckstrin-like domain